MEYVNFAFFVLMISPVMNVVAQSPLYTYTFAPVQEVTISGTKNTECSDTSGWGTDDTFKLSESIDVTFALTQYQNNCWKDGRYNNGNYKVEIGQVSDSQNVKSYPAFKVYPPSIKYSQFLASKTIVYFSFSTGDDFKIYSFDGKDFSEEDSITVAQDTMTKTNIEISELTQPIILLGGSSSAHISVWPLINGVERAIIFDNSDFTVKAQRFDISAIGNPFDPSKDWKLGPSSWSHRYGTTKRFFIVHDNNDEGVVWQDPDTLSVYVTWIDGVNTVKLPCPDTHYLEAAAGNNNGDIAYVTLAKDKAADDKVTPNSCKGYKVNGETGQILVQIDYDTSKSGLNILAFFDSGASLVWNTETNQLGLMISRTMTQGSDGLTHQGCIAVVLDGNDMSIIKNLGQTSGHSWSNSLGIGSNGKFFGADLGDNYPRGINIQEFDATRKRSKVVYTFKTQHATSPTYSDVIYTEISTSEITYYKQSNDNNVYTEIAHNAAIEVDNANAALVIFAGERPSLDNSVVGSTHNAPRNIGFVKVARDIQDKTVLSSGATETGGFYNFGGGWSPQENKGVTWLTSWNDKEEDNASRLKAVKIGDMILVLFEKWTPTTYKSTHLMGLDEDGKITRPLATSSYNFQIPYADELYATAEKAIFYSGVTGKLVRYEIVPKSPTPSPTPAPQAPTSPTTTKQIDGSNDLPDPSSSNRLVIGYMLAVVMFAFLLLP